MADDISIPLHLEIAHRDAELVLVIKTPFEFSQLARITIAAAPAAPCIVHDRQKQELERLHAGPVWPAKTTAHLINEAQPGGPCIVWADERNPSQCLLICPKSVVGKVYKALKTKEKDYQCKMQDVKSSIQLKGLSVEHLDTGLSMWMSQLLIKAGWALLAPRSFLKPDFLARTPDDSSLSRLQTQLELRSPHHIVLRLKAGQCLSLDCRMVMSKKDEVLLY